MPEDIGDLYKLNDESKWGLRDETDILECKWNPCLCAKGIS